ncbi:MAG TPA: tetratricopeptide repeat protein [Gemmataceae bacterium]|nr:tetratricopeptide repeat protein [Gemmataceae bacterium]
MTTQTPTITPGRLRLMGIAAAAMLLACGLVTVWSWHRNTNAPVNPPLPSPIEDAEVRHAIERARNKVLDNPRSANAWGRLGMTLLAQLFDREADRCFAEAARLDPNDARWPFARGQIALKREPDRAVPLLRQALQVSANGSSGQISAFRLPLAEALLERGELDEAEKLFQDEREQKPNDPRASFGLGLIATERGDRVSAVQLLTTASESELARKRATAQLAALARQAGDVDAADRYEKEAAALPDDPAWPDPFLDHVMELRVGQLRLEHDANELANQHRYAEAAELWLAQLSQRRTCQACTAAGINCARLRDYDRALPLLCEAVELDPDSPLAHYTLALVLFTRGEQEEKQWPDDSSTRQWFRASIPHAKRATRLKTDYAQAYLFWGLAHKHLGNPAAALSPLRQGIACQPDSLDLQLALGEVLLAVGQSKEAAIHLQNARRLDPKEPRVLHALERLQGNQP